MDLDFVEGYKLKVKFQMDENFFRSTLRSELFPCNTDVTATHH